MSSFEVVCINLETGVPLFVESVFDDPTLKTVREEVGTKKRNRRTRRQRSSTSMRNDSLLPSSRSRVNVDATNDSPLEETRLGREMGNVGRENQDAQSISDEDMNRERHRSVRERISNPVTIAKGRNKLRIFKKKNLKLLAHSSTYGSLFQNTSVLIPHQGCASGSDGTEFSDLDDQFETSSDHEMPMTYNVEEVIRLGDLSVEDTNDVEIQNSFSTVTDYTFPLLPRANDNVESYKPRIRNVHRVNNSSGPFTRVNNDIERASCRYHPFKMNEEQFMDPPSLQEISRVRPMSNINVPLSDSICLPEYKMDIKVKKQH